MKKISCLIYLLVIYSALSAQIPFIQKGKIEYERRTNIIKEVNARFSDESDNSWFDAMKKNLPTHNVTYFDLYMDNNKTMYKPGRETPNAKPVSSWITGPAQDNVIYMDMDANETICQKNIFENTYLLKDSLKKIEWRITNETRTIAGFECRKAVSIIMDSIYVIAFYADQLPVSSGPESFNGLPGLILGLAIPRINTTWFATKLEMITPTTANMTPPKKGKKTDFKSLQSNLKEALNDWKSSGERYTWYSLL